MMPRRPGEISPRRAAQILGVHKLTIYRWCDAAINGEPGMIPRGAVRKTATKRIWLQRSAIDEIAESV